MYNLQVLPVVAAFDRESTFEARNCNNTPVPVQVQSLIITPDPIVIFGNNFTFNVSANITVHELIVVNNLEVLLLSIYT